jgi:mycofactocin precursor
LSSPDEKGDRMEPNQQIDTDTELVTETLVEEVSIDGMCGVY